MPAKVKLSRLFKSMSIKDKKEEILSSNEGSPLLRTLPPEIRNLVYEILISNYILSTDPRTAKVRIAEEAYHAPSDTQIVLQKSSADSLPYVNRQVRREFYSVLAVALPQTMRFRESKRAARDRAMSLSPNNIKQRLQEPTSNEVFNRLTHLVIDHKFLFILIRPIEERFFTSLRRIDITGVPTDSAEIKARHQMLNFRGYHRSEELSNEDVWVYHYDARTDEYEYHRRMSFVQLSVFSGQINPAQEARALRSISDARIAGAQPAPY